MTAGSARRTRATTGTTGTATANGAGDSDDESIGDAINTDGADAWKNADGTDFIAGANDIVEWDGSKWHIVFDSSSNANTTVYTTNLNTGIQYKFEKGEWLLAFEGEYPQGTWRIKF